MILNVAMSEYLQSVRKTKHSTLKESPEADPRTHVELTNRYPLTADRWYGCLKPNACLFQRPKPITCRFQRLKTHHMSVSEAQTNYKSVSEAQNRSHVVQRLKTHYMSVS